MLTGLAIVILVVATCAFCLDLWFRLEKNFMNPVLVGVVIVGSIASICWAIWQTFLTT